MFRSKQQGQHFSSTKRSRRGFQPGLEVLENRWVPAVSVGLDNVTGILSITGGGGDDQVKVIHDDNANQIRVQHDGTTQTFTGSLVEQITVNLGNGNNSYVETLQEGTNFQRTMPVDILTGAGDDTITFDLAGNANHWATLKEDIEITLQTGDGADSVQINLPYVEISNHLAFTAELGRGQDQFNAIAYGAVGADGSLTLDVRGEGGRDVLTYYGAYDPTQPAAGIRVADQALLSVLFDGGAGKDKLYADYVGEVDGLCSFYLHGDLSNVGGEQRDKVNLHMNLKPGSVGDVYGYVLGGEGDDVLTLLAEGSAPAGSQFHAIGGAGFDKCVNTFNVAVQECEA